MISNTKIQITIGQEGADLFPFEVREEIARERGGARPQGAWRKWGQKVTFITGNHNAAVDVQRQACKLGYRTEITVTVTEANQSKKRRDT